MSDIIETPEKKFQPLIDDEERDTSLSAPILPHRKRRWWPIVIVILLILSLLSGGILAYAHGTNQSTVQYTQQAATQGNLTLMVSATGPVNSHATYPLNFSVAGQVSEIDVRVGQQVTKGQTLAKVTATSMQDALMLAEQNVTTTQTTYNDALYYGATQTVLDNDHNALLAAQDQLKTVQDNFSATILTAPANATVAAINGQVGQNVSGNVNTSSASSPLIMLVDTSSFTINADVNEADIGNVQAGQQATFTVEAYPQTFSATVSDIQTVGQTNSNVVVYPVDLAVDLQSLKGAHLYPGMTATVNIITQKRSQVLLVSNAALNFTATALQAGVVDRNTLLSKTQATSGQGTRRIVLELQNGQLTPVAITVGITNGTNTEVLSGLQAGAQVVTGATGGAFANLSTGTGIKGGNVNKPIRLGGGKGNKGK
ncbi:MAG: efflux RND transporter periplasmic adaptor subunit [Ktedonobacteraceae bacterium]